MPETLLHVSGFALCQGSCASSTGSPARAEAEQGLRDLAGGTGVGSAS